MLKVTVDPDTRSLIVAGDRDMVVEVLQQIYDAENKAKITLGEDVDLPRMGSSRGNVLKEEEIAVTSEMNEIEDYKINESYNESPKIDKSLKKSFESNKAKQSLKSTGKISSRLNNTFRKEEKLPNIHNRENKSVKTKKVRVGPDGALFIESIDAEKPLEKSDSCLEFLLISFCKHFALKPKQAAGLLTQGGKYLTHVIAKGLRGKHQPIVS